jgi:hypothetical protein
VASGYWGSPVAVGYRKQRPKNTADVYAPENRRVESATSTAIGVVVTAPLSVSRAAERPIDRGATDLECLRDFGRSHAVRLHDPDLGGVDRGRTALVDADSLGLGAHKFRWSRRGALRGIVTLVAALFRDASQKNAFKLSQRRLQGRRVSKIIEPSHRAMHRAKEHDIGPAWLTDRRGESLTAVLTRQGHPRIGHQPSAWERSDRARTLPPPSRPSLAGDAAAVENLGRIVVRQAAASRRFGCPGKHPPRRRPESAPGRERVT